jgi:F5/8 type C domain
VTTDNKRAVLVARQVTVRASSEYSGWPATNAVDGDAKTSWYSGSNDSAAHGTKPFIEVVLDQPSVVRRVTILGNRDPSFLRGYTVFRGRLEVFDARGRVLTSRPSDGTGNRRDFDFLIDPPVHDAVIVRFTSLIDEGDKNSYGDIAIAEVQVD